MRKELLDGDQAFVIHNFLTPAECDEFVRFTERLGYTDAPITTAGGPVMVKEIRNNERVMVDDRSWATALWDRARPLIPSPYLSHSAVGLNERFRFYRYDSGQTFRPHYDGYFARNDEQSQLTFMVYLNGGCEGGETILYMQDDGLTLPDGAELRVTPEPGKALVFHHTLLHEGAPVTAGRKYVLRTDVMYRVR